MTHDDVLFRYRVRPFTPADGRQSPDLLSAQGTGRSTARRESIGSWQPHIGFPAKSGSATEGGRFELPVRQSDAQRFSRAPHSTTLPPLQGAIEARPILRGATTLGMPQGRLHLGCALRRCRRDRPFRTSGQRDPRCALVLAPRGIPATASRPRCCRIAASARSRIRSSTSSLAYRSAARVSRHRRTFG